VDVFFERSGKRLTFKLKPLSSDAIATALPKADQYRMLNQPWEAESICRDILAVDPSNQQARVILLLALTEQFGEEQEGHVAEAESLLSTFDGDYERAYYAGLICERRAKELLAHGTLGAGPAVYDLLAQAMKWFETAEANRPPGNDDALLRWNTCARMIMRNDLRPAPGPPRGTSPS
jgi:hypothetical protein